MAKLSIEQAPAPSTPRLFLLTAPVWACVAGMLVMLDGTAALASRWGGGTLAVVHAFTLGFLGNAMFGSLLQFLPVAAGVRVHGGRNAALALHALLNVGTVMLVIAFRWPQLWPAWWGGALLGVTFVWLVLLTLPGLLRAQGQLLLRWGIGMALCGALVTALMGLVLTMGLSGVWALPLVPWTNIHAAWGGLGWVLVLLASVSRVVGPMFQGMTIPRPGAHAAWQAVLYGVLAVGTVAAGAGAGLTWFRASVGVLLLTFAGAGLVLQARATRLRKAPLTAFWALGFAALFAGAAFLLSGDSHSVLVGTLALGVGLPLLVVGMQLEIVAFLGWIALHRECGKGVRLPGVHLLLPGRDKWAVLCLHLVAAGALCVAVLLPSSGLARAAGLALLAAHGATFAALCGVGIRSRRFLAQVQVCR